MISSIAFDEESKSLRISNSAYGYIELSMQKSHFT